LGLRCFIAIELSAGLREKIGRETGGLRASEADVRWVPAENLHLTLKFLGSVPDELVPDIRAGLARVARGHARHCVRLAGTGVFPDPRRPRVVWVGVEDSEGVSALQRDVEAAMEGLGFEPEGRPYTPHLTLGRVKSPRGRSALMEELGALRDADFGEQEVREVSLMKSELRPGGARYERLFAAPLGGR
jgi:2'-5' RNA ligase